MAVHMALLSKIPQRKYPKEPAIESKRAAFADSLLSGLCLLSVFYGSGFAYHHHLNSPRIIHSRLDLSGNIASCFYTL